MYIDGIIPWTTLKREAQSVAMKIAKLNGGGRMGERMYECGQTLYVEKCPEGHHERIVHAALCKQRACPVCATLRARRYGAAAARAVAECGEDTYVRITLTQQTAPAGTLREHIKDTQAVVTRVMRSACLRSYIRVLHVELATDGVSWNVHTHILATGDADTLAERGIMAARAWMRETAADERAQKVEITARDVARSYAIYINHVDRIPVNDQDMLREWICATKSVRRVSSGGKLRMKVKNPDAPEAPRETCPTCGARLIVHVAEWDDNKKLYINTGTVDYVPRATRMRGRPRALFHVKQMMKKTIRT